MSALSLHIESTNSDTKAYQLKQLLNHSTNKNDIAFIVVAPFSLFVCKLARAVVVASCCLVKFKHDAILGQKNKFEIQTCACCACTVHMQAQATHTICSRKLTNKKLFWVERLVSCVRHASWAHTRFIAGQLNYCVRLSLTVSLVYLSFSFSHSFSVISSVSLADTDCTVYMSSCCINSCAVACTRVECYFEHHLLLASTCWTEALSIHMERYSSFDCNETWDGTF